MVVAVRSLLLAVAVLGGTLVLLLLVTAAAPVSATVIRTGPKLWARWMIGCARVLAGVRLVVRGTVPNRPALVAFKHQSAFETYLLLYLFDWPAVVMKAELRRIPLWGRIAERHGAIFVDRDRGAVAMKTLIREGRARAAAGRPIIIFPEGTRVPVGAAPPLKAGLSALYGLLDLPVVPVAVASGHVWPRGFLKRPGEVVVAFLPEVPPGLPRAAMEARVHAAINADPETAPVA
ncbi:lysophospholipid acyltransferase family protein [Thermaurantiacus sp.]